jgi:anaerobic ribonucleoside-triphosphate reductase activating protein
LIIKTQDVVFQEVPGEISLSFSVAGCQLGCKGCHSAELWYLEGGWELTPNLYLEALEQYEGLATCVLFLGGEWEPELLVQFLKIARDRGLKTCLYTGEDEISQDIFEQLTYLKTGRWVQELGGLIASTSNQLFINCETGENLTHLFRGKNA